jgi:GDPmannose 4,6-dehydratase
MIKKKIAFITGITGQDGAWLAKFLLKKNYIVHGLLRRSSSINTKRIDDIFQEPYLSNRNLFLHYGDLTDSSSIQSVIAKSMPDEIYNLAAQSHVKVSYEMPEYTTNVNTLGTLRVLESIKSLRLQKKTKFYQASSSEMFGNSKPPQNEKTIFRPESPYAAAKLYSFWITTIYRNAYKIFASNGILFNHESIYRGETFLTKKVCRAVAKIYKNKQKKIIVGNLYSKRDWGDARDYVRGMWQILQHHKADDFVLGTGKSITVKKFIEMAFKQVNIKVNWKGSGLDEKGYDQANNLIVEVSNIYFRPTEVNFLKSDPTKAYRVLKWKSTINLENMIKDMITEELKNC